MKAILKTIKLFLFGVPQEAKDIIYARMIERKMVPEGCDIDDCDFWEVKEGDYGFCYLGDGQDKDFAVWFDGRCYYGEV